MATLLQSLMLLVSLMVVMSVSTLTAMLFARISMGERVLAGVTSGATGLVAYIALFHFDLWVRVPLQESFISLGRHILGLV